MPTTRPTRRAFLRKASMSGVAVVIGSSVLPLGGLVPAALAQTPPDDPTLAAFGESIELALVAAYGTLQSGGKVKAAAAMSAVTMFAGHHQDHADAFNDLAGSKATKKPNAKLLQTINDELDAARDEAAALSIAYQME